MEKAILLFLVVSFLGRHLQEGTHYQLQVSKRGRRIKLSKPKDTVDSLCEEKLGELHVYKSIYCFKKLKKTHGTHLIFTLAQKHHHHKKTKDHLFIYIPLQKWGKVTFF